MLKLKYLVSKILTVEVLASDAADALDKGSELIYGDLGRHVTLDWQVEEVKRTGPHSVVVKR